MTEPTPARRILQRDAATHRLRRLTLVAIASAGTLAAAFAGLAAKAFPGRSTHRAIVQSTTTTRATATPPPLVSVGNGSPAPAPPASAPSQTQAPPAAVSGGT